MEELVQFGSIDYLLLLGGLLSARGMDFLSTWIATPNLILEANPIARRLGWRFGIGLNLLLVFLFAFWPLPAVVIITTSLLVAARNFQSAWLMRSMGEHGYRCWMSERLSHGGLRLYLLCLAAQAIILAVIGATLIFFSRLQLVPFGIGTGMITYAIAVVGFTLLSIWRIRRSST